MELTRDQGTAQLAGEVLWRIATSEDRGLAAYDCPAYRAAERTFLAVVRAVYGLSALLAGRVRDLLAEYGPDDSLQGTRSRGVRSYVEFTLADKGKRAGNRYHY